MIFEDLRIGKIRLEFGNWEQINCIDREIQRIEEKKDIEEHGGDEKVMKLYRVSYAVGGELSIDVYAYDEDQALDIADDNKYGIGIGDFNIDIDHLETKVLKIEFDEHQTGLA